MENDSGQAIIELIIASLFLSALFSMSVYISFLSLGRLKAQSLQHYLLFSNYRAQEGIKVNWISPKSVYYFVSENENFEGRRWFGEGKPVVHLWFTNQENLEKQWKTERLPFEKATILNSAKIETDPWDEHPIREIIWGLALAKAIISSNNQNSSFEQNDQSESLDLFSIDQFNSHPEESNDSENIFSDEIFNFEGFDFSNQENINEIQSIN